jgi:serine/threonine-protein kinase
MSKIVTGAGTGTTNLTAHNMVFGTPEYMSPEQARGDELDARCDVYAAGIMLYEMLTGAPPFTGATPLNVLTEHLTSAVPPPSSRAKDGRVTPALESVVLHALARNRDERYPSASALAAAIMHARAAPNDVHSLRPGAFATSPEGTDAFALTMPAIDVVAQPALPSRRAIVNGETPSDPPRALGTPGNSVPPVTKPSAQLPSKTPSTAPRPVARAGGSGAGGSPSPARGSVRPKRPSEKPAPPSRPLFHVDSTHTWIILWVLAGLASIALGVYFALR